MKTELEKKVDLLEILKKKVARMKEELEVDSII
jgi:hypothetical protein